jgi:hypothetical protein
MTTEDIKEFQQAIGTASWKLNLDRFGEAIGTNPDYPYTKDKFKQFAELNSALSRFDPDTLMLIIEGGKK